MSDVVSWIKPVIVLVPGAWNTSGCFNLLIPFLSAGAYRTRCVSLLSVGAEPPVDDVQPDVDAIRSVLLEETDAGQDVLLLMHDYAAVPGGEAVRGLDKATRLRSGLDGGVACLFYVASPLLPAGSCFGDVFREKDSWVLISRNQKVAIADKPTDIFCPEIEPELAKEYAKSLQPHSYQTFFSRTTWEPYKEIPCFYLFCKLDKVISLGMQRSLVDAAGIKFESSTMNVGHCPFLAQPEELAKAIRRAAKESTRTDYSGVIARDYGFRAASRSYHQQPLGKD